MILLTSRAQGEEAVAFNEDVTPSEASKPKPQVAPIAPKEEPKEAAGPKEESTPNEDLGDLDEKDLPF